MNQSLNEHTSRQQPEQLRWQETLEAMEAVAQGRVVVGGMPASPSLLGER
ncbi:MAG: hypothetical protein Q7U82_13645 [Gammaproteobacteria bacterium]|nr:hypothetical protein [Gammaproteobacteria bacterium]